MLFISLKKQAIKCLMWKIRNEKKSLIKLNDTWQKKNKKVSLIKYYGNYLYIFQSKAKPDLNVLVYYV